MHTTNCRQINKKNELSFNINDGSSGFLERILSAKNFSNYWCQTGVFGKHSTDIPQINLINLHGSAYWRKKEGVIIVDYSYPEGNIIIPPVAKIWLEQLSTILNDESKNTNDILDIPAYFPDETIRCFWDAYNKLPIVNPTKWKFHETVFEEHYYQMLRLLSYQLEEPNSALITFAFSFADEHILNLVKRSLSNPKLQVFICCYNKKEMEIMASRFKGYKNVKLITLEESLSFTKFNDIVFNADTLRDDY